MAANGSGDITLLLRKWHDGDADASRAVWDAVHPEIRSVVRKLFIGESRDHTLQPTAVVNEVYLRIVKQTRVDFSDRLHFIGACASIARRVLVDHARKRKTEKRGGSMTRVTLDADRHGTPSRDVELLALNHAMEHLGKFAPREVQIVELRYFGGLTIDETASVMNISRETVKRDWKAAKAILWSQLALSGRNGA